MKKKVEFYYEIQTKRKEFAKKVALICGLKKVLLKF